MDAALNPYTPGSGVAPPVLAGRDGDIAAFDALIARTKLSRPARSPMLSGLRGVGKTVLLNRLRSLAEHHDWMTVQFEARPGKKGRASARQALVTGFFRASARYKRKSMSAHVAAMLSSVTSFSLGLGVQGVTLGVERDPGRASTGSLELDLQDVVEDICRVMRGEHKALVIFIDELQDLDDELLEALVTAQHFANQRELPFFLVGAGLPNLSSRLAEARSYAERIFDYREVGQLEIDEAEAALRGPAEREAGEGVMPDDVLSLLSRESGRYPYFIQEFGSAMWEVAQKNPFTMEESEVAVALGRQQLDAGFFPSRWDRATPAERDYLSAMALDSEVPSKTGQIAARLGKPHSSLGPARSSLITKGLIYVPGHGEVAFTVPGMAAYINRQEHLD
ncbi:MAG: AAA family ATPase [Galactobacter sp.]